MDLVGTTLGNYQIIQRSGGGGMAVVYKAFQASLRRYVALKVLPEYFKSDPEFVARFQREARSDELVYPLDPPPGCK
jgi:serine/threonine protein kinase